MKKKFVFLIIYIIFFFNSNLLSENNNKILKVGLLAPLTGSYSELGNSLLYSLAFIPFFIASSKLRPTTAIDG